MRIPRIISIAVSVVLLASCTTHSPEKLSSGTIVKQYNSFIKDHTLNDSYVTIPVGLFEMNESYSRLQLRQLQAAGLVNYKVSRYAWWEKSAYSYSKPYTVTRYYWGYSYEDTEYRRVRGTKYDFLDHYVVDVSLTPKGEKLALTSLPEPKEIEDKDLIQPEIDKSKYKWNQVDLSENWPDIPNPFLTPEPEKEDVSHSRDDDSHSSHRSSSDRDRSESQSDNTERIDATIYNRYNALAFNEGHVYMKAVSIKAVKARNIQISTESGVPKAKAELILKTYGATDPGRIFNSSENGYKSVVPVTLTYYWDKGWVLDKNIDFEFEN